MKKKIKSKSFDEMVVRMADGYSIQAKTANKFWLVLLIVCIISIFAEPAEGNVDLPFALGKVNSRNFYFVNYVMLCVFSIAFGSSMIQAVRTRRLAQVFIDNANQYLQERNMSISYKDIFDCLVSPTYTRVAPVSQFIRGRKQFEHQGDPSKLIKLISTIIYLLLKLVTHLVLYITPGFAILKCYKKYCQYSSINNFTIEGIALIILLCLTFFVFLVLFYADIIYEKTVIRKVLLAKKKNASSNKKIPWSKFG